MSASANVEVPVVGPVLGSGSWKEKLRRIGSSQLLMWLALTCLFTTLPLAYINQKVLNDPDIWWHMRAGEWILQNHHIPHVDPFSSTTLGRPWVEYCWAFDIGAYCMVRRFDLVGIIWFQTLMRLALTAALFTLVRCLMPQFWRAFVLTAVAVLAPLLPPRTVCARMGPASRKSTAFVAFPPSFSCLGEYSCRVCQRAIHAWHLLPRAPTRSVHAAGS